MNTNIFGINFSTLWQQLLPPSERQPIENAWGTSLMKPLDWNNGLFNDYITGSTYPLYSFGTAATGSFAVTSDLGTSGQSAFCDVQFNTVGISNGTLIFTFYTPGYSLATNWAITASTPTLAGAISSIESQLISSGFTSMTNAEVVIAPLSYGATPNFSWSIRATGTYVLGTASTEYFVSGVNSGETTEDIQIDFTADVVNGGGNIIHAYGVECYERSITAGILAEIINTGTSISAYAVGNEVYLTAPILSGATFGNALAMLLSDSPVNPLFTPSIITFGGGIDYPYVPGNRIIWLDRGVYENLSGATEVQPPNPAYWLKVNNDYRGAIERTAYNAITLNLEYALNRNFMLTGFCPSVIYSSITQSLFAASANTIYINNNTVLPPFFLMGNLGTDSSLMTNNSKFSSTWMASNPTGYAQYDYTVYWPSGGTSNQSIEMNTQSVTNYVNQFNMAGIVFNVVSY